MHSKSLIFRGFYFMSTFLYLEKSPINMRTIPSSPRPGASFEDVKELHSEIRSCIISRKGGMPLVSLRDEYKALTGEEDIPYLKCGYVSLFHCLRDIGDVKSSRNDQNEPVLIVEGNKNTKHLQELISKQKDPKTHMRRMKSKPNKINRTKRCSAYDENRNLSSQNSSSSDRDVILPETEETCGSPIIYERWNIEEKPTCNEPVVRNSQLIGDDYFLQLCIKYRLGTLERYDRKSAITCGTVQSGLTIKKAIKRLDKISTMSNKLIINVGTVDVYNRRTAHEMVRDYRFLLEKLKEKYGYSNKQITVCTLPPMGNISASCQTRLYSNHASLNNWLRNFAKIHNYNLLDLHQEFIDDSLLMKYDYFQENARMVSGTIHPHVLWNYFGRQKVMKLLYNNRTEKLTDSFKNSSSDSYKTDAEEEF